jgi:hypothetical protein
LARHNYEIPFHYAVQKGAVPGWQGVFFVNSNPAVATTEEDIWYEGGVWTRPTAAGTVSIVSTDADDTAAGAGAQVIAVEGLDADWNFQSELIATSGATPAVGTKSFIRINRIAASQVGATTYNEGAITASIGGDVQAHIAAKGTIGRPPGISVPAGHVFVFHHWTAYNDSNKDMDFHMNTRDSRATTKPRIRIDTIHVSASESLVDEIVGAYVPPKYDIWFSASASTGTASYISSMLEGYFVEDTQWESSGSGVYGAVFAFTRSDQGG